MHYPTSLQRSGPHGISLGVVLGDERAPDGTIRPSRGISASSPRCGRRGPRRALPHQRRRARDRPDRRRPRERVLARWRRSSPTPSPTRVSATSPDYADKYLTAPTDAPTASRPPLAPWAPDAHRARAAPMNPDANHAMAAVTCKVSPEPPTSASASHELSRTRPTSWT